MKVNNLYLLLISILCFGTATAQVTTFDANGTYTVPLGVSTIKVSAWGAGGGGGYRSTNGGGGGGGAGAFSYREIAVTPGQIFTVVIGTGGSGGTGTNPGGDTRVHISGTNYVLAKGGSGAANNDVNGATGGLASAGIGDLKIDGGNGITSNGTDGGKGGDSPNGGAGGAGRTGTQGAGSAGTAPGGGGGGARRNGNNQNGGNGGNGRVTIEAEVFNQTDFTADGSFTVPNGVTSIGVYAWGGGGSGGGRSGTNGASGGGGGGAYSYKEIAVNGGQVLPLFVGGGGTSGNAGGDTYIGVPIALAKGGSGVDNNTTTGGTGGQASAGIGDLKIDGGNGVTSNGTDGGNGGDSPNGGGYGGAGRTGTQGVGSNGTAPGGGGGGAKRTSSNTRTGGAGGAGQVSLKPNNLPIDNYTSSNTYTILPGTTSVQIQVWGGGGGGGSRTTNGGGGGAGGGAYSYAEIPVTTGDILIITVGSGGTAGNAGGDSSVAKVVVLAKGGSGVDNNIDTGSTGGQASAGIGDTKYSGGKGADSASAYGGGGGSSAGTAANGNNGTTSNGGSAPAGGGNGGNGSTGNSNGSNGTAPGGGGGGARRTSGTRNGGAGGGGQLSIIYKEPYWGSGSRDLYPNGAKGGRAYLRASTTQSAAFPFPYLGTHYVYAEEGEAILLASDAQTGSYKRIYLYNPANTDITPTASTGVGTIPDRAGELAGPKFPSDMGGTNSYTPLTYIVPQGGTGIYKVEFRGTSGNDTGDDRYDYSEANSWPGNTNTNYLIAWDISVAKQTNGFWAFQPGRAYMNEFVADNPSFGPNPYTEFRPNSGFYGKFIIATRDGFVYEADNNGNQGISHTFMVNNKGFYVTDPFVPSYASRSAANINDITDHYHDPRTADNDAGDKKIFTHKFFYTLPGSNMPESSTGAVPGGETWLLRPQPELNIQQADFEGADGATSWAAGSKGGFFVFVTGKDVEYNIVISSPTNAFPTRTLSGYTDIDGENKVYWDGKDGAGNPLPVGTSPGHVVLELKAAEVHFPFIDMELNQGGLILKRYNKERTGFDTVEIGGVDVPADRVYWNDTAIGSGGGNSGTKSDPINASHTVNPDGFSSTTNGHIWGIGSTATSGTFGDNQGMDTWTFTKGEKYERNFDITIKKADLMVSDLKMFRDDDLNTPFTGDFYVDDEQTFTMKVKNNTGPTAVDDAVFRFEVPEGFVPNGAYTFNGNGCGAEVSGKELTFDPAINSFVSKLNLPVNCEVSYTIKTKITDDVTGGRGYSYEGIMRPDDVYDPDGTNTSDPQKPLGDWENDPIDINNYFYPPFSPFFEAEYNGVSGSCPTDPRYYYCSNNAQRVQLKVIIPIAKDDINQASFNTTVKGNLLTNDENIASVTEVKFLGTSIPFNIATVLSAGGTTYGRLTVKTDGTYVFEPDSSFVGSVLPISYIGKDAVSGREDGAFLYISVTYPNLMDINTPPVANFDTKKVNPGQTVTINPLINDSDINGDTLSITEISYDGTPISTNPASPTDIMVDGLPAGTAYQDASGNLVFEANKEFKGEVPFNYAVLDSGVSIESSITVKVVRELIVIDPNDDARARLKGETININILDNDAINGTLSTTTLTVENSSGNLVSVTSGSGNVDAYQDGEKIGVVSINGSGVVTFVPEAEYIGSFNMPYRICDTDSNCNSATLYLSYLDINLQDFSEEDFCYDNLTATHVSWSTNGSGTVSDDYDITGADGGAVFDIVKLDNSFNMKINGVSLASAEIQFQVSGGLTQNIRFADGSIWEKDVAAIWTLEGDETHPIVRLVVDRYGLVSIYGSKYSSNSPLYQLERLALFGGNHFNIISWNDSGSNTVEVSQLITGPTVIDGYLYGRNLSVCDRCFKDGNFDTLQSIPTQIGISAVRKNNTDNWPQTRESAWLALESNTKGFVINRLTSAQIAALPPANLVAGMMVYNINEDCLQINVDGSVKGWKCFDKQYCPPVFACGDNVTFAYKGAMVTYGTVEGADGRCWMDRNLGASNVAINYMDSNAYGDYFQWGRLDDGHQTWNSSTSTTRSSTDIPGNANFITTNNTSPYDWRNPQNNNLWNNVNGTTQNNPCPYGWRVPTIAEWQTESATWSPQNGSGAFDSSLKLPSPGYRAYNIGVTSIDGWGYYWSSDVSGTNAKYIYFNDTLVDTTLANYRGYGGSVRCIKN